MLFSGGRAPRREEKKDKRVEKDETLKIQESTFMRWANFLFEDDPVKEVKDLVDPKFLTYVTHLITGTTIPTTNNRPTDISVAISTLFPDEDEKAHQLSLSELVEGVPKTVLALTWQIMHAFWRKFAPEGARDRKLAEAIKEWCLEATAEYEEVGINDFTSSWRDGYAFNALIHSFDHTLVDMDAIREMRGDERLDNAFQIAFTKFQVPKLLHAKDLHSEHLDLKSVVCYLMTLYLTLVGQSSQTTSKSTVSTTTSVQSLPTTSAATTVVSPAPQPPPPHPAQQIVEQHSVDMAPPASPTQPSSYDTEQRSRKSSSSSQKSGKGGKKRKSEEQVREYEQCLEQVLTWLLEAEEELGMMGTVNENEVETVKQQFKQHEQFMLSLTHSQDSVGRVLHRGQQLSQKVDEDLCQSIIGQLLIVNQRWEAVRALAMQRQNLLQHHLNRLQHQQLDTISSWLIEMEKTMATNSTISDNADEVAKQIDEHAALQEKIDAQQNSIQKLSTFVAVVDECEQTSEREYEDLEKLLQMVGQRWMTICEWAETRAKQLDGLVELLKEYDDTHEHLNRWLSEREEDLTLLRSAKHLETDEEIIQQMGIMHRIEALLEKEHNQFVRLSQISTTLYDRYQTTNGLAATRVKQALETVTQRWDNIVTRLEEYSQMLVRTGKADVTDLERPESTTDEEHEHRLPHVQFAEPSIVASTDEEGEHEEDALRTFAKNVQELEAEIDPLYVWTNSFVVSEKPEDMRKMIQVCQKRLREIKAEEVRVNALQLELEDLHELGLDAQKLGSANDAFDRFMKKWSRIVTKISESLNSLSKKNEEIEENMDIAQKIGEWLHSAEGVIGELEKISRQEREKRLAAMREQLAVQQRNIEFLRRNHHDSNQLAELEAQMREVVERMDSLKNEQRKLSHENFVKKSESDLLKTEAAVGDVEGLKADLDTCERLLKQLEERRQIAGDDLVVQNELADLEAAVAYKQDVVADAIQKTQKVNQKMEDAFGAAEELRKALEELKRESGELPELQERFKELRDRVTEQSQVKNDAVGHLDDVCAQLAKSKNPRRDELVEETRRKTTELERQWREMEVELDDHLSCLKKEQRKRIEAALRQQTSLVDELREGLKASEAAADAEELSEHLDNLERLIDGLSSEGVDSELDSLTMEESFMRDSVERLRTDRGVAVDRAKERVARLHDAIAQCEQFEQQLCNCQSWCNHMHHILNLRISADIHALDVPHEYKQMGLEFEEYENLLTDLAAFIEQNKNQWSSSDRLQLQLEHATNQLNELRVKFEQFKQPVIFDDRLDRVLRELADLENSIDDLTGIKAENCEYSLLHAKQLQKSVENAMEAITELESNKDGLLREGILSGTQLERVVDRLEQTQTLQQQLQSRAEATVEKLERCNNWLEKLEVENSHVDKILNEIESGIDTKDRSSLEEEVTQIEEMEKVLLKGMPAIRRVAEFEKLLRENSIKIDETSQSHWKGRVAKIQRQLSKWKEDLKDRSSGGETSEEEKVMQTVEDMRSELEDVIQNLESVSDMTELEVQLTRQRSLKQRLEDKCRHLTALSDKAREKVSEPVAELLSRWNVLETKCQPVEELMEQSTDTQQTSVINVMTLPELEVVELGPSFVENVPKMLDAFECANDRVNFDDFPVDDVDAWNDRVAEVATWFNDHKVKLDAVLDEGRALANNGRMELELHEALEKLDNVVSLSNKVEVELDANRGILKTALERNAAFKRELHTFNEVLDQLEERNLNERAIAQATQKDLIDRQNQIESLELKAHEIHCSLPGSSSLRPNLAINEFNRRLGEIEDRLRKTLAPKPGQALHSDYDRASISSAGAMDSLAMEVQETEDERSRLEHASSLEVTTSPKMQKRATPTILIETVDTLDQAYLNMDEMEEFFATEDAMPYEDLEAKMVKLDQFEEELERGAQLVESLQMTMDIVENEHATRRIATLRDEILSRRDQLLERQATKDHLECHYANTEQLIAEIGAQIHRTEGRNRSPDLEELESEQLAVEDLLPRAAVHLNQCETKLQPLEAELSAAEKSRFDEKLEAMTKDFKVVEAAIKERRERLDERCADQSHLMSQIDMLEFWCEETEADIQTTAHRLNEPALNELYKKVFDRVRDYPQKVDTFHQIEHVKDRFVVLKSVEHDVKHDVRRTVSELGARVSDLRHELNSKKTFLERATADCTAFWNEFRSIQAWSDDAQSQVKAAKEATIYVPSQGNLEKLRDDAVEKCETLERLRDTWNEVCSEEQIPAEEEQQKMLEELTYTIESLRHEIEALVGEGSSEKKSSSSVEEEPIYSTIGTKSKTIYEEPLEEVEEATITEPEYGTLTTHDGSTITTATDRAAQLKGPEAARMDVVVQMRHWVFETERDASATVDVSNVNAIREAANKMQNRVDEMKLRQCDVLKILDESRESVVRDRADMCRHELERVVSQCQRRKCQLNKMVDTTRNWEALRNAIEIWLTEGSAVLNSGARASELSEGALKSELERVESWVEQLEGMRAKMSDLNKVSNELLDEYRKDEGHNLSHQTSKINMQWTKFNDNIRIRRAVLEASLRSRSDFHSALSQFEEWIGSVAERMDDLQEATNNVARLKDTEKREDWISQEKEIRAEIDAHREVIDSVTQMGNKLVEGVDEGKERNELINRLEKLDERWTELNATDVMVRERLESAREECDRLTNNLSELLYWIESQSEAIYVDQPLGGDLASIQKQNDNVKGIEKAIEERERDVQAAIELAHGYLMQHDLRPQMYSSSVLEIDSSPKSEVKNAQRRIGVKILADSDRLKTKWAELKEQCAEWSRVVESGHREMQDLDKAVAESLLALGAIEADLERRKPVEKLRLDQLRDGLGDQAYLQQRVQEAGLLLDDVNDSAGRIQAANIEVTRELDAQIRAVNERYVKLKKDVVTRGAAMERAFRDFGPSSEHFLFKSVYPPWQRAISKHNQLPYYVNHQTHNTQWDHPHMVEILQQLAHFNQVKFCAYRTGMKLRALQKRLCLDLVDLRDLEECFKQTAKCPEEQITAEDMVACLVPLFEAVHVKHPKLLQSVALAVDLAINLLLNIYDPCRDSIMRCLSFKVALVVLSSANLEDKYKYLFQLISTNEGVDHKRLAILFYDLIHIPKLLGESAAFGGSNVEPSVRSCFERAKYPPTIGIDQFLAWLKDEPQSVVWLPVMHRLTTSETAKHQSKCNVCKMLPIVGLRYRCLRCFNFDICQNCFFSQRTAKNHKLTHPMQEYCMPATSREDMRDFGALIRNKLRGSKTRTGYLPVETVDEGVPLENRHTTPQNPTTEPVHHRIQLCSQRLARLYGGSPNGDAPCDEEIGAVFANAAAASSSSPPVGFESPKATSTPALVKSPAQLISQVEQMRKEELDQLLHKLQLENHELKKEIEKRKRLNMGSTPNLEPARRSIDSRIHGRSVPSLQQTPEEHQFMEEARALRLHKQRLEERSKVLEEQNRQLALQLDRLKKMIGSQSVAPEAMEQSWMMSAMGSPSGVDEDEGIDTTLDVRRNRMDSLISTVDQLGKAMESFVVSVVNSPEGESDGDEA
ncbi:hypothetical protein QR680_011365 [Steinernema hermaphroditum]|uniref:Protein detached n=1 Tax=Steinernema hermaphroditum TaxID=289476 RepID=A0AA39MCQ7_9BILA|nr:hypothetical protein QR680_011365 [Steinernema hermaphroditum]